MGLSYRLFGAALLSAVVATAGHGCSAKKSPSQETPEQAARAAREETKKIVVARVNGSEITMDALVQTMNRLAAKGSEAPSPEQTAEIKKAALDRLVLQELAVQRARSLGIAADPKNVDAAIMNLRMNLGGVKEYNEFLEKEGVTEKELRAQVERSLTVELIFAREVLDKIEVPEKPVREEYLREKHRYVLPEKVLVTDVVVTRKDDRKRADELLKAIKADPGRDPWKLVLDGTFIVRTLEIKKDREPKLHAAAKKLKPGGLSGVVLGSDGYHIMKLKTYEPSRQLTFEEVRPSLEMKFRVPEQEKRLAAWEQEMKKDAVIEIVDQTMAVRKAE